MRVVLSLVVFLSLSDVLAQEGRKGNPPPEQAKLPSALQAYPDLVRMRSNAPRTLAEAHAALEQMLSAQQLAEIDAMPSERDMSKYHFGLGLTIRNGWGLGAGSPLARHMEEMGFITADEMSSAILGTFWCKRHAQDFRLQERADECKRALEIALKEREQEKNRVARVRAAIRRRMMGLRLEKKDVPIVRVPSRDPAGRSEKARFLSPFRGGVFLTILTRTKMEENAFVTRGYYYDPKDYEIHQVRVAEVSDVRSAVVAGQRAWFAGSTDGKAVLIGIDGRGRIRLALPQEDEPPQLGVDGQSLLAVYSKAIFRLADLKWIPVYSGEIRLPRSGPPPELHGNTILFRDEGRNENAKQLWLLTLRDKPDLTSLAYDTGLLGPSGPPWENSFSYCVTRSGDLWACVGEGRERKSVLRRSKDASYSIAIMCNSVRFTDDLDGSNETDQGLSVSAVTALPDDSILLVGDAGLYLLKGNQLIQEFAFTNARQDVSDSSGRFVFHWHWYPSNVLVLDDRSYLISGALGGIYLLRKGYDDQWSFLALDEKLGDPVIW